jgi:hypothetical protein
MTLAAAHRCSEYIGIESIIVSELKFRDIQQHIFCAHFVERHDHAPLEARPETRNRVGVDRQCQVSNTIAKWRVEGMEPRYFRDIGGCRYKILPLHPLHTLHTLHSLH